MSRPAHLRLARTLSVFLPLATCLLISAGCNNTCVSIALNSPGSTVNVKVASPPPTCTLATANGAVHLEIGATPGPTSTPSAVGLHIAHLFVTLAGVDAHSDALAGDGAPGWQSLVPQLQTYPLQVDLLADFETNGSSPPFLDSVLPAGVYRQIRLRLATRLADEPRMGEPALETNRCGSSALHCAVLSDGGIQPLAFSASTPNFRILPMSLPSGREGEVAILPEQGLYIQPDSVITVRIELDQARSWLWPSSDSLHLTPVFRLSVR